MNDKLGTDPGAAGGHGCSSVAGRGQEQPWEACLSAQESVSEGGDSCIVSQEKQKPEYLKVIPEKMKLFSQFLGKKSWFAGDKVRGRLWDGGSDSFPVSEFGAHSSFACLQLTYVDFLAYDLLDVLRMFEPKCLDAFPNLKDFMARFEVMPGILFLFYVFRLPSYP